MNWKKKDLSGLNATKLYKKIENSWCHEYATVLRAEEYKLPELKKDGSMKTERTTALTTNGSCQMHFQLSKLMITVLLNVYCASGRFSAQLDHNHELGTADNTNHWVILVRTIITYFSVCKLYKYLYTQWVPRCECSYYQTQNSQKI